MNKLIAIKPLRGYQKILTSLDDKNLPGQIKKLEKIFRTTKNYEFVIDFLGNISEMKDRSLRLKLLKEISFFQNFNLRMAALNLLYLLNEHEKIEVMNLILKQEKGICGFTEDRDVRATLAFRFIYADPGKSSEILKMLQLSAEELDCYIESGDATWENYFRYKLTEMEKTLTSYLPEVDEIKKPIAQKLKPKYIQIFDDMLEKGVKFSRQEADMLVARFHNEVNAEYQQSGVYF